MKTLKDLFELIYKQTELNDGKALRFTFEINTHYNWVSMFRVIDVSSTITEFSNLSIETESQIQLAYWMIVNKGRNNL